MRKKYKPNRAGIIQQCLSAVRNFEEENNRLPTVKELAEITGTSVYTAKYRVQMIRQELQIDLYNRRKSPEATKCQ